MTYRLLTLDLDGTTFGNDLVIRPRVMQAVRAVQAAGVQVSLATGRMFQSALPFARQLGVSAPLICYQGAVIRPLDGSRPIWNKPVPLALAREAVCFALERGYTTNVYLDDQVFTQTYDGNARFYEQLNRVTISPADDVMRLMRQRPTKLVMISGEEGAEHIAAALRRRFDGRAQVVQSHRRFAEITALGVNKGSALRYLARRLGVPLRATVAVGDQQNDVPMLDVAGLAVAMGNAAPAVLEHAAMHAPPVSQDGVAWVIEQVFGVS